MCQFMAEQKELEINKILSRSLLLLLMYVFLMLKAIILMHASCQILQRDLQKTVDPTKLSTLNLPHQRRLPC